MDQRIEIDYYSACVMSRMYTRVDTQSDWSVQLYSQGFFLFYSAPVKMPEEPPKPGLIPILFEVLVKRNLIRRQATATKRVRKTYL